MYIDIWFIWVLPTLLKLRGREDVPNLENVGKTQIYVRQRIYEKIQFFRICVGESEKFEFFWIRDKISIRNLCIYWYVLNQEL